MERQPLLSAGEVSDYMESVFPQVAGLYSVEAVGPMTATIRQRIDEAHLRPGGTVSGPTMFAIADCAFYVAVMAMIGRESLTMTTNLNINFLRKPPVADLTAVARILRLGRTLATGDVTLHSEGLAAPVAHATVSYALPRPG